jgi:hypothetical protein
VINRTGDANEIAGNVKLLAYPVIILAGGVILLAGIRRARQREKGKFFKGIEEKYS